jgi:ssDNA-binding replication factor A large subunit
MKQESIQSNQNCKIKDLNRFKGQVRVLFQVIGKNKEEKFTPRNSEEIIRICDYRIADETATMILTLYNEDIDFIEVGKSYKLSNGFVSNAKNRLRLMKGKKGHLEKISTNFHRLNLINDLS